jgi:hypothetical protein
MDIRQSWLLIWGFVAAPFAAALATIVIAPFFGMGTSDPTALFAAVVLVYLFSAPIIVAVGVPALALAHWLRLARWWVAVITGMASGALFRIIGFNMQLDALLLPGNGLEVLRFALIGAAPALLVWWFWDEAYARGSPGDGG